MGLLDFLKRLYSVAKPYQGPFGSTRRDFKPEEGMGVEELARRLGMDLAFLRAHQPSYHDFSVPKRSGGRRLISAPGQPTRALQRTIHHRLLRRLSAHPCATGFERGHSIVTNAVVHAARAVVLRMDLKDYFHSTSAARVYEYFRTVGWNREAGELLTTLCTRNGGLPQGAPTSPRLSNLVNYPLDARLVGLADKPYVYYPETLQKTGQIEPGGLNVAYTRYADDITFSFNCDSHNAVEDIIWMTKKIVAEYGYRLHQRRKLSIRRQHQSQRVTGLVVNDHVALPRRTRRWLRAVEHHLSTGRKASMTPQQFRGWQALQHMIDEQAQCDEAGLQADA